MLAGVVEDAVLRHRAGLIGAGDDVLERFVFPFGPGDQLVAVVDIGLVVEVVVIFQRLLAHAEIGERVVGIGKIGKFESHWGGFPAKLKGWIDRVLLPGRTFTTEETTPIGLPAPLLKGRTARVLITSDTPRSFMWLAYGDAIMRQLRGQILGFVGFKPVRITFFAPASDPKPGAVDKLLARMAQLGRAGR
jgi:hypothetical protein